MSRNYWLVKSEPESYSWTTFVKEKGSAWTSVRNFQARNNLRAMRSGDLVLFYHSVTGKEIVGVARVAQENFPDPTAREGDWSAVRLEPVIALREPVSLETIKASAKLGEMKLLKNSRLSVIPVTSAEFSEILRLAKTVVEKA